MTQPEALRLADHLESRGLLEEAAELRRLHARRDALLGALRHAADWFEAANLHAMPVARHVRAAIKAVEGEKA